MSPGSTGRNLRANLAAAGQEHVVQHMDGLSGDARAGFERDLAALDLALLKDLVALLRKPPERIEAANLAPPRATRKGDDPGRDHALRAIGLKVIGQGKVGCVLVAGGQGSRLGHDGPKGTYPATPVRRKTLFQLFAEKVMAMTRATGARIPLVVMTSAENHEDTRAYFERNRFFGLAEDGVRFFRQGMLPAVDEAGKLVIKAPGALFLSPDGHGGTLAALRGSGVLDWLSADGIEHLFYFQVDNPLVEVCDPVFVGLHAVEGSEFSTKVVARTDAAEKVGVLAERGGRLGVIEYSDLPDELRGARTEDGALVYSAGNIAVHVLTTAFVRRMTDGRLHLPFHLARKALPALGGTVQGVKFETFIFDALSEAERPVVMEVTREDEFAPIKNATGVDSPATSAALQSAWAARLLEAAGVTVPRDASGAPVVAIEVSPLVAATAEDLRARLRRRATPAFDGPLYLGEE